MASSVMPSTGRILVVDDEPTARKAITHALSLKGYQADAAASGTQALEVLAQQEYDLMLLDLRMPGLDGLQVMERVQAHYPDLKVIVLTAHGSLESAIKALRIGANDYLLKPSTIQDIEAAVSKALQQRSEELHEQMLLSTITEAVQSFRQVGADAPVAAELRAGRIALNMDTREAVVYAEEEGAALRRAELTANESALLACLMEHPEQVMDVKTLARAVGYTNVAAYEAQEIVRPHISRLRKKIEPGGGDKLIRTVRGKGYRLIP